MSGMNLWMRFLEIFIGFLSNLIHAYQFRWETMNPSGWYNILRMQRYPSLRCFLFYFHHENLEWGKETADAILNLQTRTLVIIHREWTCIPTFSLLNIVAVQCADPLVITNIHAAMWLLATCYLSTQTSHNHRSIDTAPTLCCRHLSNTDTVTLI